MLLDARTAAGGVTVYTELAQPVDTSFLRRYAVHSTHRLQRMCAAPPWTHRACMRAALPAPRARPLRHDPPTSPSPTHPAHLCNGAAAAAPLSSKGRAMSAHAHGAPSTALLSHAAAAARNPLGVLLAADGHREGNAPAQMVRRAEASTVGALGRASAGPHLCGASQRSTPSCRRGVCLAKCSSARPTHFPLRKRSGMKCPAPWRQL